MAEKGEETCNQDLVCPLCLDILEDATLLTCEHSFCRGCLRKFDDSQACDEDHMVCPLCRKVTKLTEDRVTGLSSNVSINVLVDEYICSLGGMMAILHVQPKCTSCDEQQVAVSFCNDCDMYLCEDCNRGHKKMRFFAKHRVASMAEMEKGDSRVSQQYDRCAVHELEKKDLFCDDCGVHACLKCVVVNHRDHHIKNKEDFENEIRRKMSDLGRRCGQEKDRLEKNIHRIEKDRQEMHLAIQNLEAKVKTEREMRVQHLKENEEMLLAEVKSLKEGFDEEFDDLKATKRQRIKSMTSSLTLVMIDRLKSLERDSLSAHTLVCDELHNLLKEATDEESTGCVKQNAESVQFHPAATDLLCLGHVEQTATLVREVDLPHSISAMAALSEDSVVVGYGADRGGTDCFSLSGDVEEHMKEYVGYVHGIAFLTNGRSVVSQEEAFLYTYNTHAALDTDMRYTCKDNNRMYIMVCTDQDQNIYAVNSNLEIYIYHGSNTDPKRVIPTGNVKPEQICVTKTGVMITSTCNTTPSKVTLFDKEGHVVSSIKPSDFDGVYDDGGGGYLYAAIDSQDRVLVARVWSGSSTFELIRYILQGTRLVKRTIFKQLDIPHPIDSCGWCHLVSLTPNLIAFGSLNHLYFIKL